MFTRSKADDIPRRVESEDFESEDFVTADSTAYAATTPVRLTAPVAGDGFRLVLWMLPIYLGTILVCSIWLTRPSVMVNGGELAYDRSLFLCLSTATLSGFQQVIGAADFNPDSAQGPAVYFILVIVGTLFTMISGSLAAVRILRFPYTVRRVVITAFVAEGAAILAGAAVLFSDSSTIFDSLHLASCAFGNCGAAVTSRHHWLPPFTSIGTQAALLPLSAIGGLGLPIIMDVYDRVRRAKPALSLHTLTAVKLTAAVYFIGTLVLFAGGMVNHEIHIGKPKPSPNYVVSSDRLIGQGVAATYLAASTTAINARTLGFPYQIMHRIPRPMHWFIVLLMMIGATPAGTGGGMKTTTLWTFFGGIKNALLGRPVSRAAGIAGVWILGYLAIAAISFIILSAMEQNFPPDRLMFITISALSDVGLSHDPLSLVGPSLVFVGIVTLIGRLAPIAVLWWMAKTTRDAEVLVG